ncbi:hypothetical protein [Mesorhizobium sp. M1E.F.Ca.ET.063.01.1.1]|uniref:hypothetical protein n=1 Tax=Mesorhizobium sp. M1E.F.Ca.ET.063.01.1.1 TaxID=2496750 RepID=UPI001677B848
MALDTDVEAPLLMWSKESPSRSTFSPRCGLEAGGGDAGRDAGEDGKYEDTGLHAACGPPIW